MKLIYKTSSNEFTDLVRIGFDREGIEHYISEATPATFGLGASTTLGRSIFILNQEDEALAAEVLRELGAFDNERTPRDPVRKLPSWLLVGGSVFFVVLAAAILSN